MIQHVAISARFLLPGPREGMGRYTDAIVHALAALRQDVRFSILVDRPVPSSLLRLPNLQLVVVPPPARHPMLYYIWYGFTLPRVLKRLKPDVFFSPEPFAAHTSAVPQVVTLHDLAYLLYPETKDFANRHYYTQVVPQSLGRAKQVIAISTATATDAQRYYNIPTGKMAVVYNGVDHRFSETSPSDAEAARGRFSAGQPYFLALSALEPRKNLVRLMRAFDAAVELGLPHQLLIAGRQAWKYGPILDAHKALKHPTRVVFLGYIADADQPALYAGATALAYVSLYEGFGLPIAEAARCGTPSICSDTSSMPEVGGAGALYIDPLSEASITEALLRLGSDTSLRANLSAVALTHSQQFDWSRTAQAIWTVLERVAAAQ